VTERALAIKSFIKRKVKALLVAVLLHKNASEPPPGKEDGASGASSGTAKRSITAAMGRGGSVGAKRAKSFMQRNRGLMDSWSEEEATPSNDISAFERAREEADWLMQLYLDDCKALLRTPELHTHFLQNFPHR
jgi:hypothetical protein